ncbi:hypothetical protein EZV62_008868 [Acer yangbiense]|uniref:SUI1 domain-containing protein n=1 Tax=Acer yangbiense TaxID=1000413 RepID=A0A5C7IE53_9ROSI|nr:hypothetical protein EZV62_008868 [Acer yangbiense]
MSRSSLDSTSTSVTISSSSNSLSYTSGSMSSTSVANSTLNATDAEPGVGGVPNRFHGITPGYLWQTQLQQTPLSMDMAEYQNSVSREIEARLKSKCEKLADAFIDDIDSSSGSHASSARLPERVKVIIEEIEREEAALQEDLYSADGKFAEYYHESLPALHKIRKYLVETTEEASVADNKAVTRLHEYQGVDPRFDKIARQYHDIVKVDCMDQVRFVVLYDGKWTDSGGKFRYESGKSRGVILPRETSYRVLLETVCGIVEEDPSEVNIQMKFNYVAPEAIPPIEVVNDDDVKFFLAENADAREEMSRERLRYLEAMAIYSEAIAMVEGYQQAVSIANLGGIRDIQGLFSQLGLKNSPQAYETLEHRLVVAEAAQKLRLPLISKDGEVLEDEIEKWSTMSRSSLDSTSTSVTISSSSNSISYTSGSMSSTSVANSALNATDAEPGVGGVPNRFLGITPGYLWQTQLQQTPLSMDMAEYQNSVSCEIEARLKSKCEKLADAFIDDIDSSSGSHASSARLPERVKVIIEEIEREEAALQEDLYSADAKFAEYYHVLEQILGVLITLVKDLKLEHQHKYDELQKTWLCKRCETMSAKLRVLEHGLLLATYTQESLPALHKIRKYLVEATEEASIAYNKAVTRLREYQGVDPRFDTIARQYHDIVKSEQISFWVFSSFQQTNYMVDLDVQIPSAYDPFSDTKDSAPGAKGYVHLRVQQRNGKKCLTTVQGLREDFSYQKILKDLKKEFCCNGNVVQDKVMGKVLQLQGDQRMNVLNFLVKGKIVDKEQIKIHDSISLRSILRYKRHVHLRVQQRNGKKCLTTVQGLREDFSYQKILKDLKKEFCCNGNVVQDKVMGKVLQLQGDQRMNVLNFLVKGKIVDIIYLHSVISQLFFIVKLPTPKAKYYSAILLKYNMIEIDEDGRLDVRRFDFYVGICIHYDGKKTLTSVRGFREGVSYEWMLNFMKGFLRCRGNVVDHKVLGKIILLQGDWSKKSPELAC